MQKTTMEIRLYVNSYDTGLRLPPQGGVVISPEAIPHTKETLQVDWSRAELLSDRADVPVTKGGPGQFVYPGIEIGDIIAAGQERHTDGDIEGTEYDPYPPLPEIARYYKVVRPPCPDMPDSSVLLMLGDQEHALEYLSGGPSYWQRLEYGIIPNGPEYRFISASWENTEAAELDNEPRKEPRSPETMRIELYTEFYDPTDYHEAPWGGVLVDGKIDRSRVILASDYAHIPASAGGPGRLVYHRIRVGDVIAACQTYHAHCGSSESWARYYEVLRGPDQDASAGPLLSPHINQTPSYVEYPERDFPLRHAEWERDY